MVRLNEITTVKEFHDYVKALQPIIGTHGGRRFVDRNENRSYSMNQIVDQFKKCVESERGYDNPETAQAFDEQMSQTLQLITEKDGDSAFAPLKPQKDNTNPLSGALEHKPASFYKRAMTTIRQRIGNFFYNRKHREVVNGMLICSNRIDKLLRLNKYFNLNHEELEHRKAGVVKQAKSKEIEQGKIGVEKVETKKDAAHAMLAESEKAKDGVKGLSDALQEEIIEVEIRSGYVGQESRYEQLCLLYKEKRGECEAADTPIPEDVIALGEEVRALEEELKAKRIVLDQLNKASIAANKATELFAEAAGKAKVFCEAVKQESKVVRGKVLGISGKTTAPSPLQANEMGINEKTLKAAYDDAKANAEAAISALKSDLMAISPSFLVHLIKLKGIGGISDADLDRCFEEMLQRNQWDEIQKVYYDLKRAYMGEREHQAGYYLLRLIKEVAKCDYAIPEKDSFDSSTVTHVLLQLDKTSSIADGKKFVELLHLPESRSASSLYRQYFVAESLVNLEDPVSAFCLEQLKHVPMDQWEQKGRIITSWLEMASYSYEKQMVPNMKEIIAKTLAESEDRATSEIGENLLEALKASSKREAAPYVDALKRCDPNFDETLIKMIFG